MAELLTWLEGSALGEAMRGMGVWSYGVFNLVHILGIATLFGSMLVVDLRLLGAWRGIPYAAIAAPTVPLAVLGFSIAALSGLCMITTNAVDYIGNPFLLIKFPAIALGLLNAALLSRLGAWRHARAARELTPNERRQLALAGGASLALWLTVIGAGRLIAYW